MPAIKEAREAAARAAEEVDAALRRVFLKPNPLPHAALSFVTVSAVEPALLRFAGLIDPEQNGEPNPHTILWAALFSANVATARATGERTEGWIARATAAADEQFEKLIGRPPHVYLDARPAADDEN